MNEAQLQAFLKWTPYQQNNFQYLRSMLTDQDWKEYEETGQNENVILFLEYMNALLNGTPPPVDGTRDPSMAHTLDRNQRPAEPVGTSKGRMPLPKSKPERPPLDTNVRPNNPGSIPHVMGGNNSPRAYVPRDRFLKSIQAESERRPRPGKSSVPGRPSTYEQDLFNARVQDMGRYYDEMDMFENAPIDRDMRPGNPSTRSRPRFSNTPDESMLSSGARPLRNTPDMLSSGKAGFKMNMPGEMSSGITPDIGPGILPSSKPRAIDGFARTVAGTPKPRRKPRGMLQAADASIRPGETSPIGRTISGTPKPTRKPRGAGPRIPGGRSRGRRPASRRDAMIMGILQKKANDPNALRAFLLEQARRAEQKSK